MFFNFKLFFKFAGTALFSITEKRSVWKLVLLFSLFPFFLLLQLLNRIGLLLDELFYRGYRDIEVRKPVFIVGLPRSGTTFMHRLLSRDEKKFTSMKLWEITFAPSITQKKMFCLLSSIDRLFGGYLKKLLLAVEKRIFKKLHTMHPSGFFDPEEDAMLMIHTFSSPYLYFLEPSKECFYQYFRFDEQKSEELRAELMNFYKRCIKNHLYVFGKNRQFLSKNPAFCSKIMSINQTFPDSKIIYLVRSPHETIPSMFSLFSYLLGLFQNRNKEEYLNKDLMDFALYWYRYPLEKLNTFPVDRHMVVKYDLFTENPEKTLQDIYSRFGLALSPSFREILKASTRSAKSYKSRHKYELNGLKIEPGMISNIYKDVMEEFGFEDYCA